MLKLADRMGRAKPSAIMVVADKAKKLKAEGRDIISFRSAYPISCRAIMSTRPLRQRWPRTLAATAPTADPTRCSMRSSSIWTRAG